MSTVTLYDSNLKSVQVNVLSKVACAFKGIVKIKMHSPLEDGMIIPSSKN